MTHTPTHTPTPSFLPCPLGRLIKGAQIKRAVRSYMCPVWSVKCPWRGLMTQNALRLAYEELSPSSALDHFCLTGPHTVQLGPLRVTGCGRRWNRNARSSDLRQRLALGRAWKRVSLQTVGPSAGFWVRGPGGAQESTFLSAFPSAFLVHVVSVSPSVCVP